MDHVLEAIYERGEFKPLEPLNLPEHQRVTVTIHLAGTDTMEVNVSGKPQIYG